jgi:glycosyltransferase involved in cell wall biosynthesis
MALAKPVVATDVGGNRELIKPGVTGLLVPPGDPAAVAEAIMALLRDEPGSQAMGEKAREKVVDNFSVGSMVQQYQDLYEELLCRKRGSHGRPGPVRPQAGVGSG